MASVKGPGIHPLYAALVHAQPEAADFGDDGFQKKLAGYGIEQQAPSDVMWNFERFLVGRDGEVLGRYVPGIVPEHPQLVQAIERALG